MHYPKELFRGDQYRVVFSGEEHGLMKAAGWSDEREPGKAYRVHTAVNRYIPTIEEAVAAGYSPEAAERIVTRTALAGDAPSTPQSEPLTGQPFAGLPEALQPSNLPAPEPAPTKRKK